jgi:cytoskeleton protein RodZ
MSEDDFPNSNAAQSSGASASGPGDSFGQRLAAAREGAGLGVGDVAAHLRLHVNQVRALESGDLAKLPEPAYVRGFVRSYARLVGLDAGPLLDDLNTRLAPASGSVVEGMTRTRDYSPVKAAAQEQSSRLFVLGLALAGLVALGLVGWYATRQASQADAPPQGKPAGTEQPTSPPGTEPAPAPAPAPGADDKVKSGGATSIDAPAQASAGDELGAPLTLRFNGVSWVEVTDAAGKVLLSQVVQPGDTHQPNGPLPLWVIIGDASKATVAVRGQPFTLEPVTRGNVARFSVK